MEKKLFPYLWDFFRIIKEFPGPASSLTAEHAWSWREGPSAYVFSLPVNSKPRSQKVSKRQEKEQLHNFAFFFSPYATALDCFGATFLT